VAKAAKGSSSRKGATAARAAKPAPRGQKSAAPAKSRAAGTTSAKSANASVARVPREPATRGQGEQVERQVEHAPKTAADVEATNRGRYVYCIIRASSPMRFGPIGMDDQSPEVYTINFRDMAAVVSDVPIAPLDSTRENVLGHERVNETVMRDHTVIPMSFGTIFKTREDILELLRSAYDAFADVLAKMQDKLEFGLKVLWDRDEIVRAIEQEDEDIHRLKSEISSQKGSTYFARMQYGRLIDAALQQRSERYVAEFLQRLRDVSVASRVNRAIGDKMIMNAAFLVQREHEPDFDRRIKEIASRYDKLTFKYTGPWPPYNFVNIRLKLERAGQH
jgi:Gas vesicle synthesis protein GvpL/GvpF